MKTRDKIINEIINYKLLADPELDIEQCKSTLDWLTDKELVRLLKKIKFTAKCKRDKNG